MRDLLLNRFRGALLGAVLGEAVSMADRFTWAQVRSGAWFPSLKDFPASRSLIVAIKHTIDQALKQPNDAAPSMLAVLPVALFFHDSMLRPQIDTCSGALRDRLSIGKDAIESASNLAVGEAIAIALREELLPRQLLPRLSEAIAPMSSTAADQLVQVQTWIETETSLSAVQRSIAVLPPSLAALTLAFYGWLSTPEQVNLALLRMQGSSAAIWAGAMAGAYSGVDSIAIDWWQPLSALQAHQAWRQSIATPIDRLAEQLFAAWAGLESDREAIGVRAIATAGLIRPR